MSNADKLSNAIGKSAINALSQPGNSALPQAGVKSGTTSGRVRSGSAQRRATASRIRISLSGDQIYEDCLFISKDKWEKLGIPDIFGEYQIAFKPKIGRELIVVHAWNLTQVEFLA